MKSSLIPVPEGHPPTPATPAEQPLRPTQAAPPGPKLHDYTRLKLALAAQVRAVREILKSRGSERRLRQCEELMVKLAEDRFTLAVLGQFKRGKSSLMNALIGRELLPVGSLPLTSVITVLRFGPRERLLIQHENWGSSIPREVPVARLADYVTERGNPGNRLQVQAAYLELPLPFLRRGLEFVDTPGVGSAVQANTDTTYGFLPACDAALFVTGIDTPLTRAELEFLRDARRYMGKLFLVANKTDLLPPAECAEVLDFITRTVRAQTGADEIRIFPVSARLGLTGKLQGNTAAWAQSGLPVLEEALAEFLTREKTAVFLASVTDKATRLLEQESTEMDLRQQARTLSATALQERVRALKQQLEQNAAERARIIVRLRDRFVRQAQDRLTPELEEFLHARLATWPRQFERLLAHSGWHSARRMVRRVTSGRMRRLQEEARRWLAPRTQWPDCVSTLRTFPEWNALQVNGAASPGFAAGFDDVRPDVASFASARLEPPFSGAADEKLPGAVRLAWLPARCQRSGLRAFLTKASAAWIESLRRQMIDFVGRSAGHAFDLWAAAVATVVSTAGARVLAALEGKEPALDSRAALSAIRERLVALRNEIRGSGPAAVDLPEERKATVSLPPASEPPAAPTAVGDLARELQTRGCPVCDHLVKTAQDFFAQWQYALYTREAAQEDFAAGLGFCPLHLWQLEAISSPVGMSVGHAKLAERVARLLRQAGETPAPGRAVAELIPHPRPCRVCQLQQAAETRYLAQFAAYVRTAPGREAYARSQGLCLRHLTQLIAVASDGESAKFLLSEAARRFEEMAEDMQSYGMKTEALRRQLSNSDEHDAYLRALTHIAGERRLSTPWPSDGEI